MKARKSQPVYPLPQLCDTDGQEGEKSTLIKGGGGAIKRSYRKKGESERARERYRLDGICDREFFFFDWVTRYRMTSSWGLPERGRAEVRQCEFIDGAIRGSRRLGDSGAAVKAVAEARRMGRRKKKEKKRSRVRAHSQGWAAAEGAACRTPAADRSRASGRASLL